MLLLAAAVVAVIALGGGDEEPASADSKNRQSAASGLSVAELASKAEEMSLGRDRRQWTSVGASTSSEERQQRRTARPGVVVKTPEEGHSCSPTRTS